MVTIARRLSDSRSEARADGSLSNSILSFFPGGNRKGVRASVKLACRPSSYLSIYLWPEQVPKHAEAFAEYYANQYGSPLVEIAGVAASPRQPASPRNYCREGDFDQAVRAPLGCAWRGGELWDIWAGRSFVGAVGRTAWRGTWRIRHPLTLRYLRSRADEGGRESKVWYAGFQIHRCPSWGLRISLLILSSCSWHSFRVGEFSRVRRDVSTSHPCWVYARRPAYEPRERPFCLILSSLRSAACCPSRKDGMNLAIPNGNSDNKELAVMWVDGFFGKRCAI